MGCDIHAYLEVAKDNKWTYVQRLSIGRDYFLFGILAGVRSNQALPIDSPRGVPVDTSNVIRDEIMQWDSDGHTHSWLSLGDIRKYPYWNTFVKEECCINTFNCYQNEQAGINLLGGDIPRYYATHREVGFFDTTAQFVSLKELYDTMNSTVKKHLGGISDDELKIRKCLNTVPDSICKTFRENRVWWKHTFDIPYSYFASQVNEVILPAMEELEKQGYKPEDIRMVFFFDN